MGELTWLVDETTGQLVVEGLAQSDAPALVGDLLPQAIEFGCAKPIEMLPPPIWTGWTLPWEWIQLSDYYLDSLVEGPGRRSVVRVQGCPIHCPGCWVPETWDKDGGTRTDIPVLVDRLLAPNPDGVTILGGEPFAQSASLANLCEHLRAKGCPHIVVYTGYTYEYITSRKRDPAWTANCRDILESIDILIDGPYVAKLAPGGPWTGSTNQRVIDVQATRAAGKVVLYGA